MTANEAKYLVQQFVECRLPKEQWTHEAHFIMACWFCSHQPIPIALATIKESIKKYNLSIGGANTEHSGYHETITVFYTRLIVNYLLKSDYSSLDETLSKLLQQPFIQKNFPLEYYSKELLMSSTARKMWIEPDKIPLF